MMRTAVLLCSFAIALPALSQTCEEGLPRSDDRVGGACRELLTDACILPGTMYIATGENEYVAFRSANISRPVPTSSFRWWDEYNAQYVDEPAHRFIYVGDFRSQPLGSRAFAGIEATRKRIGGGGSAEEPVFLYRNKPTEIARPVDMPSYERNIEAERVLDEVASWISPPDSNKQDEDIQRAYRLSRSATRAEGGPAFLRIRSETGILSCLPLDLVIRPEISFIELRAFTETDPSNARTFFLGFR